MMKTPRMLAALVVTALFAIAGCGGGGDDSGGTPTAEKATQAKASGNVTWCIGKDTSGAFGTVVDNFNKANPNANVKLLELPEDAVEQRRLQIQRLRAKSSECDVLGMDVIWTAEYAAQGWLKDVSDYISQNGDKFIKSTVDTTEFEGKNWGVPFNSNAGFIYYRTDQVSSAPKDWESLYKEAADNNGVVYQGFRYEGLTVNFLELLYSKGGTIVSDDGKKATADTQEVKDVLTFMADGIKNGAAPKAVTTYKEEESRRAFESGNATFMRNWPYAYALGKDSKIADKFDIATFPGFAGPEGRRRARRVQPRHLGLLEEPRGLPRVHRVRHEARSAEDHGDRGVTPASHERDVRRPGGEEGAAVRRRAEDGYRAGAAAAGVAGVSADQRGDLQQRVRRVAGEHLAG